MKFYRPDIDGLRAFAVIGVLLFHYFPKKFPGGFIGVDVFFVISGFLITSIILSELNENKFDLYNFFLKRVRRIFPSLAFTLTITLFIGYYFLLPKDFGNLKNQVIAGALFFYNILAMGQGGYFDGLSDHQPLLHLWSLGLEEQFYFLLPILLIFSFRKNKIKQNILIVFFISIFTSFLMSYTNSKMAYYFPLSRFWQLFSGSLLAVYINQVDLIKMNNQIRLLISLSFFSLLIGYKLIDYSFVYPGFVALLPTIATLILIAFYRDSFIHQKILENKIFIRLGLISFPVYLVHWLLISWSEYYFNIFGVPNFFEYFTERQIRYGKSYLSIASCLMVSFFLYRFIESPIKNLKLKSNIIKFLMLYVLIIIPLLSFFLYSKKEADYTSNGSYAFMKKYDFADKNNEYMKSTISNYRKDCSYLDLNNQVRDDISESCYGDINKKVIMLWGDSYAEHLRYGLDELLKENQFKNKYTITQITSSSCPPSLSKMDGNLSAHSACNKSRKKALSIIQNNKPKILVIAQAEAHLNGDLKHLLNHLTGSGVEKIIVVGLVPKWREDLYKTIVRFYWPNIPAILSSHINESIFVENHKISRMVDEMYSKNMYFISPLDIFCVGKKCLTIVPNTDELTTFDSGHLTNSASRFFISSSIREILK